jgi:hypothetical protein
MVAAIVAGDPDGIAEAYDRYAAPLYAYCCFMLPGPDDAAAVVRDTFLIATSRLEGLRDPGKLRSWLPAVARRECLRRRSVAGVTSPLPKLPQPASGDDARLAIELPAGLRGQVLTACTDGTPAGRAERASTAHRAGAFGPTGFPKAAGSPGPPWRRWRHPRAAAAVAAVAAVGVTAGIIVMLAVGGSHRAQASTLANGGGAGSPGAASASPPPGRQVSPATGRPTPSVAAPEDTVSPGPGPGTPQAPAPGSGTSSGSASPTASSSPSASPSASPTPTPTPTLTPGILEVVPDELALTSTGGKAVSGDFLLSAVGGPVDHYAIKVPAAMSGKVTVSPATGSLGDGGWVTVTVTVTSKIALKTALTVNPGGLTVTIVLSVKA